MLLVLGTSGQKTAQAIQTCFAEWASRKQRGLTLHLVQGFTGHSCFGEYPCRIGKEETRQCHYCPDDWDLAQYTLETCPTWAEKRRALVQEVGADLSLPSIVCNMLASEQKREPRSPSAAKFCRRRRPRRITRGGPQKRQSVTGDGSQVMTRPQDCSVPHLGGVEERIDKRKLSQPSSWKGAVRACLFDRLRHFPQHKRARAGPANCRSSQKKSAETGPGPYQIRIRGRAAGRRGHSGSSPARWPRPRVLGHDGRRDNVPDIGPDLFFVLPITGTIGREVKVIVLLLP